MSAFLTRREYRALRRVISLVEVNRWHFLGAIILGTLGLAASIALGGTAAWLIARASQHPPVLFLQVATVGVRFFGISKAVLRYIQRLASHRVAMDGIAQLRVNLYRKLADSPSRALYSKHRGELLARVGTDIDAVGDLLVKSILPFAVAVLTGILTVGIIACFSPASAAILGASLLLSGIVGPLLTMRSARLAQLAHDRARIELAATTLTWLDHGSELAVSGQAPVLRHRLDRVEAELAAAKDAAARPAAVATAIDALAMAIAVGGAIIVATGEHQIGAIAAVIVAVLVLTPLSSFEGTSELAPAAVQLVKSATAATRLQELLSDSPADTGTAVKPTAATGTQILSRTDTLAPIPTLRVDNLTVGWAADQPVVKGLSFSLPPGGSLAIVGPSGIGKSTILYTLAGIIPSLEGQIHLEQEGEDVFGREQITETISFTAEDAHIFATSVAENLRCANPTLTPTKAHHLLERAGLGGWVDHLHEGLDTVLGSGGTTVSGGERRRLLLARALASEAPIMLLDEPAEHLDNATADRLMRDLLHQNRQRSVIAVTHRLSALDAADEVIVLEPGQPGQPARIRVRGPHRELLETDATYRQLYESERSDHD